VFSTVDLVDFLVKEGRNLLVSQELVCTCHIQTYGTKKTCRHMNFRVRSHDEHSQMVRQKLRSHGGEMWTVQCLQFQLTKTFNDLHSFLVQFRNITFFFLELRVPLFWQKKVAKLSAGPSWFV